MIEQFIVAINALDLGGESVNTVNARELWKKLGVKTRFNDWINGKINKYGFVEGQDYCATQVIDFTATEKKVAIESTTYWQDKIEYFISLDMAKELAMVEANEVGKMIRRHFIACEKELRAQQLAALHLEHSTKVESLRIEYRNAAEQAIQHNTHHVELLGISLHNGLTSAQRSALYKIIDDIAHSTEDPGATNNAISSHLYRRYMHKGWLGQVHIPFNDAMDYLERVKKAYEAGYRPTYKSRLLVIEDDMLNL